VAQVVEVVEDVHTLCQLPQLKAAKVVAQLLLQTLRVHSLVMVGVTAVLEVTVEAGLVDIADRAVQAAQLAAVVVAVAGVALPLAVILPMLEGAELEF